jgi:MarR family 2-MHQ and catechol resistance regulon transcriptional repressor
MPSHFQGTPREVLALTTYIKLMRAAGAVTGRLRPRISAAGVTEPQFGVLESLYHLGALHQRDLAERILTTGGNITVVVRNLERLGLVRRSRDPGDGRFRLVELTAKGAALIRRIFPGHAAAVARELSVLSAAEQRNLGRLCVRVGRPNGEPRRNANS